MGEGLKALVPFENQDVLVGTDKKADRRLEEALLGGRVELHAHHHAVLDRLLKRAGGLLSAQRVEIRKIELRRGGQIGICPRKREDLGEMRVETKRVERLDDVFLVEGGERGPFDIELEIEVAHDRRHAAARERGLLVLGDVLELLSFELIEVLVDSVYAAEILQQLRRAFIADTGNAGDIVRRIALQTQKIGELGRRHPVALFDLGRTVHHHVRNALFVVTTWSNRSPADRRPCPRSRDRFHSPGPHPGGNRAKHVVALHPLTRTTGTFMDSNRFSTRGNCTLSSSSMDGRVALYCSSASMRNAGLPTSECADPIHQERLVELYEHGHEAERRVCGVPSGAFIVGGTAWYALCIREFPSITTIFFGIILPLPSKPAPPCRRLLQQSRAATVAPAAVGTV